MGPTLVIELKNIKILSNIKFSDPINRWFATLSGSKI